MKTATLVGSFDEARNENVKQSLYKMNPPHEGYEYVIASSLYEMVGRHQLDETYLFGADKGGEILNWSELSGSMKGTQSHAEALNHAGYSVIDCIARV